MAPISDLKHRHLEVFKRLKQGPVILANRSQPAAVLVSPERWNAIVAYIDDPRYLGTSANVWIRLQARYDLEVAEAVLAERVKHEVKVRQP
jgi:hypothetical protein